MIKKYLKHNLLILIILFLLINLYANEKPYNSFVDTKSAEIKVYSKIKFKLINESSGIVKSKKRRNVYWTHNDADNAATIFAIRIDGSIIKPKSAKNYTGIKVNGSKNRDWEDITRDKKGNLIIADSGDNLRQHENIIFYILEEPNPYKTDKVKIKQKIKCKYPDNKKYDAEAIFYANKHIYLLTKIKYNETTKLFCLNNFQDKFLSFIDEFDFGEYVTAADYNSKTKQLAVLTYDAVWIFDNSLNKENFFSKYISRLPIDAKQCEAICFDKKNIIITNEQREIYKIKIDNILPFNKE